MKKIKFTHVDPNDIPEDIEAHLVRSEDVEGARLLKSDIGEYVQVSLGERPTGGYSIEVLDLVEDGKVLIISIKEKCPKSGDMVIQAFTYPKTYIKLEEKVDCGEIRVAKV